MNNLANSYETLKRPTEALKLREEVLAIRGRVLPQDDPDTLISMMGLANSYETLNRHADALKLREEGLAIQKRVLPQDHPDTLKSMSNLSNSYAALNRFADALKLREEVLAIRRRVLPRDHPATLISMNNLAWLLATCPESNFRNPTKALELAAKTVELDPTHPAFAQTLGMAQYRVGEWQAAVTAFEKSMKFSDGGDSNNWFFLAMAHWRLNHIDEARKWYDKAVGWMEKNQPKNEELGRFRKEAAELLKVGNPPKVDPVPK
jgi:tetratricopeptide (TPR) repeat protein